MVSAVLQDQDSLGENTDDSLFKHNSIYDRILRMMDPQLDKVVEDYKIDPTKEYGGNFAKLIQSYLLNNDEGFEDRILEEDEEEDSAAISAMRQLFLGNTSKESNDTLLSILGYSWNATEENGSGEVKRVRIYSRPEALLAGLLNESQLLTDTDVLQLLH